MGTGRTIGHGAVAITRHWVSAVAILATLGMGLAASSAAEPQMPNRPDDASPKGVVAGANDTLTISPGDPITTVIERFAVAPERQEDAIARVMKAASDSWTRDEQFVGFVLLRGRQQEGGIAIYSQWSRRADEVAAAKPDDSRSMRTALNDRELLDSENFTVAFTAQASQLKALSQASVSATPLAHFGMFRVAADDRDELIQRAMENGPNSFRVKGLRSINFHRGASNRFVVNFGLWDTFKHFADLHDAPGFALRNQYYVGLADFRPDYFDVVAVVSNCPASGCRNQ